MPRGKASGPGRGRRSWLLCLYCLAFGSIQLGTGLAIAGSGPRAAAALVFHALGGPGPHARIIDLLWWLGLPVAYLLAIGPPLELGPEPWGRSVLLRGGNRVRPWFAQRAARAVVGVVAGLLPVATAPVWLALTGHGAAGLGVLGRTSLGLVATLLWYGSTLSLVTMLIGIGEATGGLVATIVAGCLLLDLVTSRLVLAVPLLPVAGLAIADLMAPPVLHLIAGALLMIVIGEVCSFVLFVRRAL